MEIKKPLKTKLITNFIGILLVAFGVVAGLVFYGLDTLSSKFLDLSQTRAKQVKSSLEDYSEKSTERIKNRYLRALQNKGVKLIKKDSSSLLSLYNDNSFSQIRDFVLKSFTDDPDIIHASFFVLEDGQVKAWQFVDQKYPKGMEMPFVYSKKRAKWTGRYQGKRVVVKDSYVPEVLKHSGLFSGMIEIDGEDGKVKAFDTYIPIHEDLEDVDPKDYKKAVENLIAEEEPVAFLRYTLSLEQMKLAIETEKKNLNNYLQNMEVENQKSKKKTKEVGSQTLNSIFMSLGGSALFILIAAYFVVNLFSNRITNPVIRLIEVAKKISKGEYKQEINIVSDDEVGFLAETFKDMSAAILKRDEELEELNKGLEDLVAKRTAQLDKEMRKVKNLLDSMRQSVFSINSDGEVVAPVSKYSDDIFKEEISGKKVNDIIYCDMDQDSEEYASYKTAMSVVFGEDDLQWMLMEDNLPQRVERYFEGDEGPRIFKMTYNPIWNEDGVLEQIMYVVDDVTEVERLERQIANERKEGAERMEILQEISACSVEDLKGYLANCYELIENVYRLTAEKTSFFENRVEIFRDLHTLKGNSRVFGIKMFASKVHYAENIVSDLRELTLEDLTDEMVEKFEGFFKESVDLFQKYTQYAESILKIDNFHKNDSVFTIHRAVVENERECKKQLPEFVNTLKTVGGWNVSNEFFENEDSSELDQIFGFLKDNYLGSANYNHFKFNPEIYLGFLVAWKNDKVSEFLKNNKDEFLTFFRNDLSEEAVELWINMLTLVELNYTGVARGFEDSFVKGGVKALVKKYKDSSSLFSYLEKDKKDAEIFESFLNEHFVNTFKGSVLWSDFTEFFVDVRVKAKEVSPLEFVEFFIRHEKNHKVLSEKFGSMKSSFEKLPYTFVTSAYEVASCYVTTEDSLMENSEKSFVVYENNLRKLQAFALEKSKDDQLKALTSALTDSPMLQSFGRYFPMVEEFSKTLGKKINLKIQGSDVYAPKENIEALNNAITHLVRNSIDHGLETPEEREGVDKLGAGEILISASQTDEQTDVVISDDGRGIDLDIIKNKFIEKSLMTKKELDKLSEKEILDLVFTPEFSTKDEVSEISGRGVGMDAVKEIILSLDGEIRIETELGKGTKFWITIPNKFTGKKEKLKAA